MRVFSETVLGVAKENVIGTEAEYEYKDGKLLRTGQFLGSLALGPSKPTHIFSRTGRMPAFAVGNMDTDIENVRSLEVRPFDQSRRPQSGV